MKFIGILIAGLLCSAHALADNEALQRVGVEFAGQFIIQQTTATLKADYSAIALHCSKLDRQFSSRFAERRLKLEQEWLDKVSKTAWFVKMMSSLMASGMSAGSSSSAPPLASMLEPERKLERLPEVPAAVQEAANRKSMEQVAMAMEPLTLEQQRTRCEAELASKPMPEKPDAKGMAPL